MNQEVWTVRSECKTLGKKEETREFTYRPDQTNQKIEEVIEAIRKVDRRVAQIMADKRRGEKTLAKTQKSQDVQKEKGQDEKEEAKEQRPPE